jgi:hypothetical protein
VERALEDLKLSGEKKGKAESVVKAYQDNVRKLLELGRADLLLKLTDVLSAEEFKTFQQAMARRAGPSPAGAGRGGFRSGRGLSADVTVERIMALDKNKDSKVTKEELPERMQDLIAKGDTNKDGALDKDEIKKLAAELGRNGAVRGFAGRGAGFRPGGAFRQGDGIEQAVTGLKLSGTKKEKAESALQAHRENDRLLLELARADLLLKMKDVLSEEEFKKFREATARRPGPVSAGSSTRGDVEKRLDQLQKDLDNLRREIRR